MKKISLKEDLFVDVPSSDKEKKITSLVKDLCEKYKDVLKILEQN